MIRVDALAREALEILCRVKTFWAATSFTLEETLRFSDDEVAEVARKNNSSILADYLVSEVALLEGVVEKQDSGSRKSMELRSTICLINSMDYHNLATLLRQLNRAALPKEPVIAPGIPVEHDPKTVVIGTDAAKRELDELKQARSPRGPEGCSPRGAEDYMVTLVLRLYEEREGSLQLGKPGRDQPKFWTTRSGFASVTERADLGPGMVEVRMHRLAAQSFGWA